MNDNTPTTEEVRAEFITNKALRMPTTWRGSDEFDRWLAAHDLEVSSGNRYVRLYYEALARIEQLEERPEATGVVTEEPEWEYGVRNTSTGKTGWPWTRDEALKQASISPMFEAVQRIRTEWVSVKQEGVES